MDKRKKNVEPLISVVIPMYNVSEYIRDALDSVLNQFHQNFEIIIIDDGSNDDSREIVKEFYLEDPRITLFQQENKGQSVARNKGIKYAKGEYLIFLDSDDILNKNCFGYLIELFESENIELIRFSGKSFGSENKFYKDYDYSTFFENEKVYSNSDFNKINNQAFSPSPVLFMVKSTLIKNNSIFFKENIIHEDELFTLEVFLNTSNALYCNQYFYYRRFRPNSTMTTISRKQLEKSYYSLGQIYRELYKMRKKYILNKELIDIRMKKIEQEMILKSIPTKRKKQIDNIYDQISFKRKLKGLILKMLILLKSYVRKFR